MNQESETNPPTAPRRLCRHGKIARLPHRVREELNRRLLDGESSKGLVQWLNELPEARAALEREFGRSAISEQNMSEWKQRGFRDWVAKTEADELMAETLADRAGRGGTSPGSRRKKVESTADRVAEWFIPHYVAAARGELAAAQTSAERWSVLRTICSDLAGLRRSDHYVERLRI